MHPGSSDVADVTEVAANGAPGAFETRLSVVPSPKKDAPRTISVRLICASDDIATLDRVAPTLTGDGLPTRVIGGVDLDERPFVIALLGASNPTVFVICVTDRLTSADVRRLAETFAGHRS